MSVIKTYKDLIIWQKGHLSAVSIIKLTRILPREITTNILTSQIIRSATSVPANIAEGFGRYKGKEYQRFLQIALGSANETEYWLMLLKEIFPALTKQIEEIEKINLESCKMLSSSLKKINS